MKALGLIKKLTLGLVPLVLALGLGWVFQHESEFFEISHYPVEIEFSKDHEALVTKMKPEFHQVLERLKGKNIWKISLSNMKTELEKLPWVKKVSMKRQFPRRIDTHIELDEMIFLYADNKNKFYPVLRSGKLLGNHEVQWLPGAPVLRNNKIYKDEQKLAQTIELFTQIPSIGPLKASNIAEIDFKEVTGLSLTLVKEKATIYFGNKNIQTKALQVLRVLDYLKSQKVKARVIDASFTKKVLVRPRKRS